MGEAKWTETQTPLGTLKFYYTQTEFLYLIVRSIHLEEADLHWKLRLIFTICFFNYILSYMIYTKYIIVCVIIYSLVCVLNFILFAGRLYIYIFWPYLLHKSIKQWNRKIYVGTFWRSYLAAVEEVLESVIIDERTILKHLED